ncbi:MAG: hypothetical protein ABI462_08545 [Ignavibacteria bacterium]
MDIKVKPVIHVKKDEDCPGKPGILKPRCKTAAIICHGMGQQVKFETLSFVSDIISNYGQEKDNVREADVRLIYHDNSKIPRAELTISDDEGNDRDIHLYEIYWASVTEGRVNAWHTLAFLIRSSRSAIWFSLKGSFERRIFGSKKKLPVKHYTSILVFIFLILLLALSLLYFAGIYISVVSIAAWIYGITSGFIVMPLFRIFPASFFDLIENNYNIFLIINLIAALFLLKGKSILKQYVGDVVAYVSSFRLSKFALIRAEIQKHAFDLARFVYCLKKEGGENIYEYDRIIFIGHSLGSLIAYDTLNAIINEFMATDGNSPAADRTKLLLTFGSPLDKTAFIFRNQKDNLPVREALAEATQPMIQNYKYRPEEWINIYSNLDIISGYLDYYDDPHMKEDSPEGKKYWSKKIKNIKDWSCWIPFAAHNQYWKSKVLAESIMKALKKTN